MKTYSKPLSRLLSLALLLLPLPLLSMQRVSGYCAQGNQPVITPGSQNSTTRVQRSYPSCTVNVYYSGTTTRPPAIYSDNSATALGNPFTASSTGAWFFYAVDGLYDINLSGAGITPPFTIGSVQLSDTFNATNFGAKGDNSTDDSAAIQSAIAKLVSVGGGSLYFPQTAANVYRFKKVVLASNLTIGCAPGVTLKLPDSFNGSTDYMFANNTAGAASTNIDIGQGCILDGNRVNQSGGSGDGNAIAYFFNGASNAVLHGQIQNFWTDGIYLGCAGTFPADNLPGNHVTFAADLHVSNSRRNDVSVICGTNILFDGPVLDTAGSTASGQVGAAPKSGLDIEPRDAANVIQNITGFFTSHDNLLQGWQLREAFTNRPNLGLNIDCLCYNNGAYGAIVAADNATAIAGVRLGGIYYGNGSAGPGAQSINVGPGVDQVTVSANLNETNAGTLALAFGGGNLMLGDGYYSGATQDFNIVTPAVCHVSTGAFNAHGVAGFVTTGTGMVCLPGTTGTFTPILKFGGGTTGITYSTQSGTYTQTGSQVIVQIHIVLTSKGSSTGAATIAGLPVAPANYTAGVIGFWSNLAAVNTPLCYMIGGATSAFLEQTNSPALTGSQGLLDTNFTNTAEIVMTISYGQ